MHAGKNLRAVLRVFWTPDLYAPPRAAGTTASRNAETMLERAAPRSVELLSSFDSPATHPTNYITVALCFEITANMHFFIFIILHDNSTHPDGQRLPRSNGRKAQGRPKGPKGKGEGNPMGPSAKGRRGREPKGSKDVKCNRAPLNFEYRSVALAS